MAKLKLVADPTFKARVGIPVAGKDPVDVEFTFKHRTRTEWDEWTAASKAKGEEPGTIDTAADAFMSIVVGWELEEEFNRDNVILLLQNHIAAGHAVAYVYGKELWDSKIKNFAR